MAQSLCSVRMCPLRVMSMSRVRVGVRVGVRARVRVRVRVRVQ
jgi:hypothetical protein